MAYNLECLIDGDLLMTNGHSMIFVGRGQSINTKWGGYYFADAFPSTEVSIWDSKDSQVWFDMNVYRTSDVTLRTSAVMFARAWAKFKTPYSNQRTQPPPRGPAGQQADSRAMGVSEASRIYEAQEQAAPGSGTAPPFEDDAFYRTLKWAARDEAIMSSNRGATCCAFVIACFQAASVWNAAKMDKARITKALADSTARRGAKRIPVENDLVHTTSGKTLSPIAFRDFSNPGPKPGAESFTTFATTVLSDLTGKPGTDLTKVFSSDLLVDAKYTYTKVFKDLLEKTDRQNPTFAKQDFILGNPMQGTGPFARFG